MVFGWEMMPRILALRWLVVRSGWCYGRSVEPVSRLAEILERHSRWNFLPQRIFESSDLEAKRQSAHELGCIIRADLSKAIRHPSFLSDRNGALSPVSGVGLARWAQAVTPVRDTVGRAYTLQ
jgi:hypothetical protein